ncbi:VOC family protein [Skermania sp. ID1734]|uniref:VOC family protein n=1 Tax=Skermania sp. ID1734 TaxID=2597516 RepID=UPI00117BFE3D|nr:VOC family protein [Skermania sp. ID1734]TSD95362.1 VOC family protein [Skermania sp. ID1734]
MTDANKKANTTLAMVTIDCDDPRAMAKFYSSLLGWEVTYEDDAATMVSSGSGPALGFGKTDDYVRPQWPDNGRKQFHLDLSVDDIAAAEQRAIELGAQRPDEQPGGDKWRVLLDPAGHPFCLAVWNASQ